jgi:hypothetical protein
VLRGKVLRIQHEDLVEDLESHVRRVLDFCDLEFEPACIEFHKTERRIHTASSEQVRHLACAHPARARPIGGRALLLMCSTASWRIPPVQRN